MRISESDEFSPPPPPSDPIDHFANSKAMCWQFLHHASLPCPRLAWAAGHGIRLVRRLRRLDPTRTITLDERNDWLELTLPVHANLVDRLHTRIPVGTIRHGIHGLQSWIDELSEPVVPYAQRHFLDVRLALDAHDHMKALELLLLATDLVEGIGEREHDFNLEFFGISGGAHGARAARG